MSRINTTPGESVKHFAARALAPELGEGTIKLWLIAISGFTQRLGADTGTVRLWEAMRPLSGPQCCVQMKLWKDDWRDYAAFVANRSAPGASVLVCAYSWGAGHGFIQFARELKKRGITIDTAILCDPVYRSWFRMARWMALTRLGTVRVPSNVGDVLWFRQRLNRPRAHDVVAEGGGTWVHDAIELDLPHALMDRAAEYQNLATVEARRLHDVVFNPNQLLS